MRHSGNVSTRPCERGDDPLGHCVGRGPHDNRDCCRHTLCSKGGQTLPRHEDINLSGHKFVRELFKVAVALLGAAALDDEVAPLNIAEFPQPLAKGRRKSIVHRKEREISDPVNLSGLLRLDSDRRGPDQKGENDREPDQPHRHLGGDGWRGV
jgi:hypothetical protein